ncbi:hypothetical protein CYY_005145 [Polysphondylium violaceum]|uniref:AB hydrolase-1 domain-containing protein n=1 Tax=Polysphondylium violaceum TaxID=133409 RepID=A0A8J4UYT4_9MYCE|nr:hypothetical protein CYY_005145 [Polysphondylium violaceum]
MKLTIIYLLVVAVTLVLVFNVKVSEGVLPAPRMLDTDDDGISHFPSYHGIRMHIRCYKGGAVDVDLKNSSSDSSKETTTSDNILLFDNGINFYYCSWAKVLTKIRENKKLYSSVKQICFFDRYGYGNSDPAPYQFEPLESIRYLRQSLALINIPPPYVYVGWSWSAIHAQTFALNYPKEINGLVLIEGNNIGLLKDESVGLINNFTIQQFNHLSDQNSRGQLKEALKSLPFAGSQEDGQRAIGWLTLNSTQLPKVCIENSQAIFSDPSNNVFRAVIQDLSTMISAANYLNQSYYYSSHPQHPLGDVPLVILSGKEGISDDWEKRQIDMLKLSSNSVQIQKTSYYAPIDNPEYVEMALEKVIEMVKESNNNGNGNDNNVGTLVIIFDGDNGADDINPNSSPSVYHPTLFFNLFIIFFILLF